MEQTIIFMTTLKGLQFLSYIEIGVTAFVVVLIENYKLLNKG